MIEFAALSASERNSRWTNEMALFDDGEPGPYPDDHDFEQRRRAAYHAERVAARQWRKVYRQQPLRNLTPPPTPSRAVSCTHIRRHARVPRSRSVSSRPRRSTIGARARDGDADGGEPPPWLQQVSLPSRYKNTEELRVTIELGDLQGRLDG